MRRLVQPELLDTLPPDDPAAAGSRRDLRRINLSMRNHAIAADALRTSMNGQRRQIVDLGAGDGDFLVRVAERLGPEWRGTRATLLDRLAAWQPETLKTFSELGWHVETVEADLFEWLETDKSPEQPIIITNLFLHHFEDAQVAEVLRTVAARAGLFVAVEPRRGRWPLFGSRLLGLIGCNAVTRHDAVVSVRAGFAGRELSALWPAGEGWRLTERPAGLFSHLFVAERKAG